MRWNGACNRETRMRRPRILADQHLPLAAEAGRVEHHVAVDAGGGHAFVIDGAFVFVTFMVGTVATTVAIVTTVAGVAIAATEATAVAATTMATTTVASAAIGVAVATTVAAAMATTVATSAEQAAATATIVSTAIVTGTAIAAVTSHHFCFTTHEGDADEREKHRDSENHHAIHASNLQKNQDRSVRE